MKTLCFDLDGVINEYVGWNHGDLNTKSIPGAFKTLLELEKEYKIIVFTTRAGEDSHITHWMDLTGIEAIRAWINFWCEKETGTRPTYQWEITDRKVPAIVYVDDRALRFTNWEDIRKYFL